MRIGEISVGEGSPLVIICGLNVIESESAMVSMAVELQEMTARHAFPMVFKASVDKANRSSLQSYRGPGFDEGLRMLARVRGETGLALITDVHEPAQAKPAAEVVDILQVPAFLCRQTDLIRACAATGRPVNIKKGQFMAPLDAKHAVEKVHEAGDHGVMITERGNSFGYGDLVVDMRGLVQMRAFAPVCLDATHSVQARLQGNSSTGGDRAMVEPLALAGTAVGLDALFVEVHPDPPNAPCDGESQLDLEAFDRLLTRVRSVDAAVRGA